ncbi:MAG TPA: hypothetical protein VF618_16030 [Thermoanaerobaculia bacterium]
MAKKLRFMAALCALVSLTAGAFAEQRQRGEEPLPGKGTVPEIKKERDAAPLLYALPAIEANETDFLEIRIVEGKHTLVREKIGLPLSIPEGATIDVLYSHPQELTKYRALEAAKPGALRFVAIAAGRLLTDEPFAAIDQKSAQLSVASAIGEIREIKVSGPLKTRTQVEGVVKEPYCQARCDADLDQCLNYWCDPRGDSCSLCYIWYNDCVMMCPDICVDPRSVTTYTTRTVQNVYFYSSACHYGFGGGERWDQVSVTYVHNRWERTTNCDGSYTDRWLGSYTSSNLCWSNSGQRCSFPSGSPGFPRC